MIFAFLQMQAAPPDATNTSFLFFGCLLFAACLLIYVFMPVPVEHTEAKTRVAFLYERKDVIYENLRDLNFEHKAGKLSDSDFETMRNSMEEEAATLLAEIDQLEKSRGVSTRRSPQKGVRA